MFFSVVVLVDLLITLLLCVCYNGIQISSTAQYTVSQLEQACTSTDILYESMTAIVNQVFADTDTTQFLSSTKIDRIQESQTAIALRKLRAANPYFRYITLYNNGNRRFVSTAYAGEETVLDAESLYEILGNQSSACFLRRVDSVPSTALASPAAPPGARWGRVSMHGRQRRASTCSRRRWLPTSKVAIESTSSSQNSTR